MSTDRKLIARAQYTYGRRALRVGDPFFAGEKEAKVLVYAGRASYADEEQEDASQTGQAGYETRTLKAEEVKPKSKKKKGKRDQPSNIEGNPDGEIASQFYSRRDLRAKGDA